MMNTISRIWMIAAVSVILCIALISCRSTERTQRESNSGETSLETIFLTGRIFVSGNEPFTGLAIELNDGSIVIIHQESTKYRELFSFQNRILTIGGWYMSDQILGESFVVTEYKPVGEDDH